MIDLDGVAAPLYGPSPAGVDLRFSAEYQAIQEARRDENAQLPQGVWTRDVKRADWPLVARLCNDVLRDRSKDLQVACWLAEAAVHIQGFAGLADGLRLLTVLCRRFWPDLHPAIEDGDVAARVAPFEWLNTRLATVLRALPLVSPQGNPELSYSWTDYVNAQLLEGLRQRDPKSVERSEAAGAVTLAAFTAARNQTPTAYLRDSLAALKSATAALAELNDALERLCGRDAPGLGRIGATVSDLVGLITLALAERKPPPPPPPPLSFVRRLMAAEAAAPAGAAADVAAIVAPPMTREVAFAQLRDIADFLQALEPNSPVPLLVRRAVAWGDMSFADLMAMFAASDLDLRDVMELLGLAHE
jgi:type VI secretion system ImpA family protein